MNTTPQLTEALFADLLDPSKSIFDLCRDHALNLVQLRALVTGDHFRELTAALHDIAQARETAQRPELHRIAQESLALIAAQEPTSNTHAETVRRAAGALLRLKPTPIADDAGSTPGVTEEETDNLEPDSQPNEPRARASGPSARADVTGATSLAHDEQHPSQPHPLNSTSPLQPTAA